MKPLDVEVTDPNVGFSAAPREALPVTLAEPLTVLVLEVVTVIVVLCPFESPVTVIKPEPEIVALAPVGENANAQV